MRYVARKVAAMEGRLSSEVVSLWGCYFQTGGLVYDTYENYKRT